MALLYRVKDWDKHFENNRTRELKQMDWVPIPNKHDGDGYTQLVSHPDGAAHFGAWVAIVEVASKCVPRGTLLRDGAVPHDAASLSRKTRIPEEVFTEVLPRLVEIGWLTSEVVESPIDTTIPHDCAGFPQDGAPSRARAEGKGRELKGREEPPNPPQAGDSGGAAKRRTSPKGEDSGTLPGFDAFWSEYPDVERKCNRTGCRRRWLRAELEPVAEQVMAGLRRWKVSETWQRGFIPLPLTWLNQERWKAPAGANGTAAQVPPVNFPVVHRDL